MQVRRKQIGMVLALTGLMFSAGCLEDVSLHNAQPRVTWVQAEPEDSAGVIAVHIWIADFEGDPVDLDLTWTTGAASTPARMAPGGHGLVGLTTDAGRFDPDGQVHLIRWDATGVPKTGVQLGFTANDRQSEAAPEVVTPTFDLASGLPSPVSLTP